MSTLLACSRGHQEQEQPRAQSKAAPGATAPSAPSAPAPAHAASGAAIHGEATPSVDAAKHGAELYGRICAVCHGARGEGYRADQAPALAQQDFLASVSDEFLEFAIRFGRNGTTMSAWATDQGGPLSNDDIHAVIAFLRTWQKQPAAKLDDGPLPGDPERGKQIFAKQCENCHGRKGKYIRLVNRQVLVKAHSGFLRYAIRTGRPPTPMPSFEKTLGDKDIEDVVGYLKSLPGWLVPGEIAGSTRPHPIPLGPVPLNPKGASPSGFNAYPKMTSVDVIGPAYKRHARMAILDARAPSDYQDRHIAGAVSVPFYDPAAYFDGLPKNTWLVCYCGCPHAESGALATQLIAAGFEKVTVLDEGFGTWIEKGYPTSSGVDP